VLHRLVSRLRARFSDTDDRDATETLELVERMADSPKLVADLAKAVERHVAADASFAAELEQLVGEARSHGVNVDEIRQIAWGDGNVQIAGVIGSQISVGQPPGWRPVAPPTA
jgi:hypothetical protein